jgi:hypothetical protein
VAPAVNPGVPPSLETGIGDATPVTPVTFDPNEQKNELTVLPTLPTAADNLITAGSLLVQNVDLAVQRGLTAEEIVEKVLEPFYEASPTIMQMASGLDSDGLRAFIAGNVPASWAILSPRGETLVIEAFELWKEDGEEDGEG